MLTTCQNPVIGQVDPRVNYSVRIFPVPAHGTLKLSREYAPSGTSIVVYVNPDPGYILKGEKVSFLSEVNNAEPGEILKSKGKYQFPISQYNVSVTAEFIEKTDAAKFTVSVDKAIANGILTADPFYAQAGKPVRLSLVPDSGYDLDPAAFSIVDRDGNTVNGITISPLPYTFTLPAQDIIISAHFVKLDDTGLIASAKRSLDAGQFDNAASFYEEAYKKNPNNPDAILYSTFAQLGNLLLDPDVRSLFGTLYMMNIPGTLDDWVCDPATWTGTAAERWYTTWPATQYTPKAATLPQLNVRISGFVTPFGDFQIAQAPATREKFNNLIFWALISSYKQGFNEFIERVNFYVFGKKFEAAAVRAASFPEGARVKLSEKLIERFDLDTFYDDSGDVYIGKPELDYIFACLRAVKAAFEYLSVYDWTIDLRPWLMSEIRTTDGLDQILANMFALASGQHRDYWQDPPSVEKILPFMNNFLNVRNAPAMSRARADLSNALTAANASMDYWFGAPGATAVFTAGARQKYQWAKDGAALARDALRDNGVFYFPEELPEPAVGAVWPDETAADYAVDIPQFFTPGVFSLTKLFTTEAGGKIPSFFKIKWYEDKDNSFTPVITHEGVRITAPIAATDMGGETGVNGPGNNAPYGIYAVEVNTANLRKIFPKGFEQSKYANPAGSTAFHYQVFDTIPLWPSRPTYLSGLYSSARNLYKYYHLRY